MAASSSTFTDNYQIKLIGSDIEAGTWGDSMNESLKRIEQTLGGNIDIEINVSFGNSTWNDSTNTLVWRTMDKADAGDVGSEGRYLVVTFKDTTPVDGDCIVEIRGDEDSDIPNRIYFITNALVGEDDLEPTITFDVGGTDYILDSGASAVLYTDSSAPAVENLFSSLLAEDVKFVDKTGAVVAGDIKLATNNSAALEIKDSTDTFVKIDTRSTSNVRFEADTVAFGSDEVVVNATTVDLTEQDVDITLETDSANALQIFETDSDGDELLRIDTVDTKVVVPVTLEVDGTLNVDGASNFAADVVSTFNNGLVVTSGKQISVTAGVDNVVDSGDETNLMDLLSHALRHAPYGKDELSGVQISSVRFDWDGTRRVGGTTSNVVSLTYDFDTRSGSSTVLVAAGTSVWASRNGQYGISSYRLDLQLNGSDIDASGGTRKDARIHSAEDAGSASDLHANMINPSIFYLVPVPDSDSQTIGLKTTDLQGGDPTEGSPNRGTIYNWMVALDLGEI